MSLLQKSLGVILAEAGIQAFQQLLDPGFRRGECAWEQARSERCKSSRGRCPLPIAEGNCVAVRWGGEQPEANLQSVVKRTRFGRALRRAFSLVAKSRPEHG